MSNGKTIWPHRWFGFWYEENDYPAASLAHWRDPSWNPEDLHQILLYLKNSPMAVGAVTATKERCRLCSEEFRIGTYLSDGIWLWPLDLSHYVESHNIRLPTEFLERMKDRDYSPPEDLDLDDLEDLPWPS